MPDREKVIKALESCTAKPLRRKSDKYVVSLDIRFVNTIIALLKEQEEERKRLLSWLGKFCRHIDNGDKWLTDEENIEFFCKKMNQQFGWFCADGERRAE